jgi:eukaryotic-like serine/threonine-protein kinase
VTAGTERGCPRCGRGLSNDAATAGLCAHCLLEAGRGYDYTVVSVLGEGERGTVYLAEQAPSGRLVALKVLVAGDVAEAIVARVRRQAPLLQALAHPCAARTLDIGINDQQQPYLAGEYVRGARITRYCERVRASVNDRVDLLAQVGGLLSEAHARGIVHGGIGASNVLVSRRAAGAAVTVTDFGLRAGDAAGDDLALMALADDLLQPVDGQGRFRL